MLFPLVQIIYWLALATWFGSVLFVAIAAQVVFRSVRKANPILPGVLSVNLDGQHGSLLASLIVGDLIAALLQLELVCAAVVAVAMVGQWLMVDLAGVAWLLPLLRSALLLAAAVLALYKLWLLWPKILKSRQEYIDHADEPEVANPAKERFDRHHEESVRLLMVRLALLLALVVFSGSIQPRAGQAPGGTRLVLPQ